MILLTVTLCLAANGTADCERHARMTPSPVECRQIGGAMAEYLAQSTAPGVDVVFIGIRCAEGTDG